MNYNEMEVAEAKRIGATPHKNSGRGMKKGDASFPGVTIDFKFSKSSFTINRDVWRKVCSDALTNDHNPAINVVLGEESKTRLWVVDGGLFEDMRLAWSEKYGITD